MSIDSTLDFVRNPLTHAALETDQSRLFNLMVAELSNSSLDEIVQDYDDAMDVVDIVNGESSLVWDVAMLHMAAVKAVHDKLLLH